MNDLIGTQNWQNERALALASLETVEPELNRKAGHEVETSEAVS